MTETGMCESVGGEWRMSCVVCVWWQCRRLFGLAARNCVFLSLPFSFTSSSDLFTPFPKQKSNSKLEGPAGVA